MKYLSLVAVALSLCICSFSFAAEESAMPGMTGTSKITKAPEFATKPPMIAATAFVKAADFAPEGGWGEKDYAKVAEAMAMNGMSRVMGYLTEKSLTPAGPSFSVWYEDPTVTAAGAMTSKWGMPIATDNEPTASITIEHMPEVYAATITYEGHPNSSMNAWADLMKFMETSEYMPAGSPMEVYHKFNPEGTDGWLVEVVWPVMKKPANTPAAEGEKSKEE